MKSITIHNMDDALAKGIRVYAEKHSTSLNQAVQALLRRSLNIDSAKESRRAMFQKFTGKWSKEEYEQFTLSTKDFEKIEKEDWE